MVRGLPSFLLLSFSHLPLARSHRHDSHLGVATNAAHVAALSRPGLRSLSSLDSTRSAARVFPEGPPRSRPPQARSSSQ